jgi:hydroxypyruvate reductase
VLDRYAIETPLRGFLEAADDETPKPGDPRLARAETRLIARPSDALDAAVAAAEAAGYVPDVLGDSLEGEAREVATEHAELARQAVAGGRTAAIISGGEFTVTIKGAGRGGPNAEYALALALALDGLAGVHAIACDTDGIDGSEDNAGAVIGPETLTRAAALGIDARARLADNDAYGFFEALGDLVVSGPTLTNVNDFRCILISPGTA